MGQIQPKTGEPLGFFLNHSQLYNGLFYFIVVSKLFISSLITMEEHTPTSIDVKSERKVDDLTLASRTESLNSNVFTRQKI